MTAKKHEREHTKTTISLAPMTVDEALAALLKTPPPPTGVSTRRVVKKTKRRRGAK
jgi:hypothetical protein